MCWQKTIIIMEKGAKFSEDKKYRYALWRIWGVQKPVVMFIGLNPSTANEDKDDATIKKIEKIVRNNGFDGFYMLNLFGLVTAYPAVLKENFEIALGENDKHLLEIANRVNKIVFCWGNFKEAQERAEIVKKMFPNNELFCLKKNKNGSPKHPLYCMDNNELITF